MAGRCAQEITRRLAANGSWMGRGELTHGMGWHESVVDDELADLVLAGTVLFNSRGREYRLGGTLWARRAMRDLVRGKHRRAAVMGQTKAGQRQYSVGLAERVPAVVAADGSSTDEQLVMAELEIPYEDLAGMERAAHWVMAWARPDPGSPT
jgi:hypothetical protein